MAGNLLLKELASTAITITSTGASTTAGSLVSAGTLDMRSGGTGSAVEGLVGQFELLAQWATVTGISNVTTIADLYLVPALDGTNYGTVDSTSGVGFVPAQQRFGGFTCPVASPATTTNYRTETAVADLFPTIYTVYLINRSGQTITSNWTLKFYGAIAQYT